MNPSSVATTGRIPLGFSSRPAYTREEAEVVSKRLNELVERTPEEQRVLLERMKSLAQMWSGRYDLTFLPTPGMFAVGMSDEAGRELARMMSDPSAKPEDFDACPRELFEFKQFFYSVKALRSLPEVCVLGTTHHECAHLKWSDPRTICKVQLLAKRADRSPMVAASLHNALEDVWINIQEARESPTARQRIEDSRLEYSGPLVLSIQGLPKMEQLERNIIHFWLFGEPVPTLIDPDVIATFERIKPYLPEYFYGRDSRVTYEVFRDKIFPLTAELEAKGVEELAHRAGAFPQVSPEIPEGTPSTSVAQRAKGMLAKLRRKLGGGDGQRASEERSGETSPVGSSTGTEGEASPSLPSIGQSSMAPTPEQVEAARRAFMQLPPGEQRRLIEEARKQIEALVAQELKKSLPGGFTVEQDPATGEWRITPKGALSGKDLKNAQAAAAHIEGQTGDPSSQKTHSSRSEETTQMAMRGFSEGEREAAREYDRIERMASEAVRLIESSFRRHAPKADADSLTGAHLSGNRIDSKNLARNRVTGQIFQRMGEIKREDPHLVCALILDNSSSMGVADKLNASRSGVVTLARVSKNLKIPFCIGIFDNAARLLKGFSQDFDDPRHRVKPKLIADFSASGDSTNIAAGLELSRAEMRPLLQRNRLLKGVILLVSDGQPTSGKTGAALRDLIHSYGDRLTVVNFVLGASEGEVRAAEEIFGANRVVSVPDANQLGFMAAHKLNSILRDISKRGPA